MNSMLTYLETTWNREWFPSIAQFPKSYWDKEENCRIFMDEIAMKNNIQSENDWKKVSTTMFKRNGGSVSTKLLYSLINKELLRKHNDSLLSVLKKFYPSCDWREFVFSKLSSESVIYLKFLIESIYEY